MMPYPRRLRNVSNRQYLFNDFDKDGVKNVDDPKPFDPAVSKYPDHAKNPKFYHRAQYGGGEVRLSDELLAIERNNNARVPLLNSFMRENPGSFGRIKTVPSTMKKLRERYLPQIGDVGGVTVLTKNRQEANVKAADIKRRYAYDPSRTDNYYKTPKGGVYYAHHIGVVSPRNKDFVLEVQVKSRPMFDLQSKMHASYKSGGKINSFRKKAKNLFDLGF